MSKDVLIEVPGADEQVPGVFQRPTSRARVPAALLLHGFSSRKERMAASIGAALRERGIASLAVDLPLHGARDGTIESLSLRQPFALVAKWKLALAEASAAIDYLSDLRGVDSDRLAFVGYSLGAFLGVHVAAADDRLSAIVLAAGGDLPPQTPFASMVRMVADPLRAVRRLDGRPLLMVNGRYDRSVTPAQAERLFEAADEPKTMRWYQGGHWPPPREMEFVADWLAKTLGVGQSRRSA